jgi:predicted nucleic acid-binding protein
MAAPVAVDTSVAVPYLMRSHPEHTAVRATLADQDLRLTGHSLAETYGVLTRLPGDARVSPPDAVRLIDETFGAPVIVSVDSSAVVHRTLAALGIAGGAVYDGLVAMAASEHGLTLLTRDSRAAATYSLIGVRIDVVSAG